MLTCFKYCLDNDELTHMFCCDCPEQDSSYLHQPDITCPVDFDITDSKCFRHKLYLEIVSDINKIEQKLKEAYQYGNCYND